ncbi:MAG: class I SAM-dependent methyltransferase [Bacteroidota bacterium]|nr:class I SAM-dependent methyltransferase [Bacteroidota bacterium]
MVPENFNPRVSHPLYFIRKGLFNKIKQYAPMLKGNLLDFGCGAKPYKSLFTNVESYVGVEYHSEGHSHVDEQIDFFYDGKTLPLKDESFDSIFSSEVFEHVFNLQEILPELKRVLKIGGQMLFTCPFVWEEHEIPVDFARYTQFALKDMLEKNGFKVVIIDKNGHTLSAIHQLFIVYLNDHWLNKVIIFSRFNFFKKIVRQILVPVLNYLFLLFEPLWPKNDRLYLNTIILAEKIA